MIVGVAPAPGAADMQLEPPPTLREPGATWKSTLAFQNKHHFDLFRHSSSHGSRMQLI